MNAHPLPRPRWPQATPPKHRRGLRRLLVGCSALILTALTAGQVPALAAEPSVGAPPTRSESAKPRTNAETAKSEGKTKGKTAAATTKSEPAKSADKTKGKREAATAKSEPAKAKTKTEAGKSKSDTAKSKTAGEPAKTKTAEATRHKARHPSVGHAANPAPADSAPLGPILGQPTPGANPTVFEHGPGVLGISLRTLRQDQIKEYVTEPVALIALALDDLRLAPVNKGTHVEINLGGRIPFAGKGDKVPTKSRRLLDVIARILTDNPQTRIRVLVHTDGTGEPGANLRQSQRAAEALRDYLTTKGVAAVRITPIGRGDEAPLVATGKRTPTWQDRVRNGRVVMIVEPLQPPAAAPKDQPAAPVPAASTGKPTPPGLTTPTDKAVGEIRHPGGPK